MATVLRSPPTEPRWACVECGTMLLPTPKPSVPPAFWEVPDATSPPIPNIHAACSN